MKTKTKVMLNLIIVNIISIPLSILYFIKTDEPTIFISALITFMISSVPGSLMYYKHYSDKTLNFIINRSCGFDFLCDIIFEVTLCAPYYCFKYLYLENKLYK